ncbi:MAG: ATP-binding cassette domain-containing protein [Nitrospirae bacterium]|nr:ATP-binding cassette domain-containing protein [Nitrospirota bacterium]
MNLYELKKVKKRYGSLLALDIPSLTLAEGNFYVVYGPNGAGKTTLLNLLAFLDKASEGEVLFHNSQPDIKDVTMVMQNPYLFKTTALGNVSRGLVFRSINKNKIEKMVMPVMKQLGIWEMRNREARSLSGGEKRRVAIARAMVLDTKALILDEPISHLDNIHVNLIENAISDMAGNTKKTIIMTTHDLSKAHKLTSNVIYLLNGKITDKPLWNMFRVNLTTPEKVPPVVRDGAPNGVKKAGVGQGVEIYVATDRTGSALTAIDPKDIIVSRQVIHSSALNNLRGRIVSINEINGLVDLVVDTKVFFHAFITRKSFSDLHLSVGEEIFLTFKASAVEVF